MTGRPLEVMQIGGKLGDLFLAVLVHQHQHIPYILLVELLSAVNQLKQSLNRPDGPADRLRLPADLEVGAAGQNIHPVMLLDQPDVFIKAAEQRNRLFHAIDIDYLFDHPQTSFLVFDVPAGANRLFFPWMRL